MIRKRNLDPSLVQWIMTATGLGPGVGRITHVVEANSSYEAWARDDLGVDPADMFTEVSDAYDTMEANRNDTMLIYPGAHDQSSSLSWSKAQTHMIGLAGPNPGGDYSEYGAVIYTDTASVSETLNITGANCMFMDVNIQNAGAAAANVAAVKLNKYGAFFKRCHISGCMAATQAAAVLACSLKIMYLGMYPVFDDCIIGHDVWQTRTGANQGVILFNDTTGQVNGGLFRNCRILSRCETATGAFVSVVGANVLGRGWTFDNCIFDNYTTGTTMNQAFYESAANSIGDRTVLLKDCILNTNGCDAWQDGDNDTIHGNQPLSAATGGLTIEISDGA